MLDSAISRSITAQLDKYAGVLAVHGPNWRKTRALLERYNEYRQFLIERACREHRVTLKHVLDLLLRDTAV